MIQFAKKYLRYSNEEILNVLQYITNVLPQTAKGHWHDNLKDLRGQRLLSQMI